MTHDSLVRTDKSSDLRDNFWVRGKKNTSKTRGVRDEYPPLRYPEGEHKRSQTDRDRLTGRKSHSHESFKEHCSHLRARTVYSQTYG